MERLLAVNQSKCHHMDRGDLSLVRVLTRLGCDYLIHRIKRKFYFSTEIVDDDTSESAIRLLQVESYSNHPSIIYIT